LSVPDWGAVEVLGLHAAISQTLATFCERIDEYDYAGAAAVFAEDCIVDYGPGRGGPVHGRQACAERFRTGQAEFRLTHHQLGQSRIVLAEPGTELAATATTYITAWHERWNGERCVVRLRYLDAFRRVDDDRAEIATRHVHAAGTEGFEGVEWNWVPRALPEQAK